jgi:hypothetical protein
MKSFLDGKLHLWIENLGTVQKLIGSGVILTDLSFLESNIISLVKNARKNGDNWIWTDDDIQIQNRDGDEVKKGEKDCVYILPSVDIAGHLDIESNNHLESFLKKRKKNLKCMWDTESSAWYPRFKDREDAERCINVINELFDERYKI